MDRSSEANSRWSRSWSRVDPVLAAIARFGLVGIASVLPAIVPGIVWAGAPECYPTCGTPRAAFVVADSQTHAEYLAYRAQQAAAREERRLLEAKERERRRTEMRAERKLRDLKRKLEDKKREAEKAHILKTYGHRAHRVYGHGVDDGQAGAHCVYGTDGRLIYAPQGNECAAVRRVPRPTPSAIDRPHQLGCVEGDCRNGTGIYVWADGSRYSGGFQDGLQHGHGSLSFSNGASYVGDWKRGTRNGMGTGIFPDGRVLAGRWSENHFEGAGVSPDRASARIDWPDLSRPAPHVGGGEQDAALIVGLEDYAHVADVPGAERNAVDWYRYLIKTRGLAPERVALLLDADATREEIRIAAGEAARLVGPRGRLWFVFIGHGAPAVSGDDGLLVGFDAQQKSRSLKARSVRRSELLAILEASRARGIHVVLDACFSGRRSDGEPLVPALQPLVLMSSAPTTDPRTTLMTAAASDEFAGPLPGAERPAFSYLALGGLRGWADVDRDGRVSAGELHRYVAATLRSTLRGRRQTPTFTGDDAMRLARSADEAGPDVTELLFEARNAVDSR